MHRLERLYIEIEVLRPGSAAAYALAIGLAGAATVIRLAIDPFVAGVQYITFFPAVIITTLICGARAGACCVVACTVAAWFFILPPHGAATVDDRQQLTTILFFLLVSGADVVFIGAMRYAIGRYRELNNDLERRVEERTKELAQSQQALLQSQKMEALGQLTGGIAHDFNNVLAVIVAGVNLLRRRIPAGTAGAAEILNEVESGVQRAVRLVKHLQSFARNQPLHQQTLNPNAVLEDARRLIARALGETIALHYQMRSGDWLIRADPVQLESALLNLALNARDAMPVGGRLTIETAAEHLAEPPQGSGLRPGDYVVLSVSDSGAGMRPEVAARAAEPFFTTKPPGKGSGLGLSQVHGLVAQSGGGMIIESAEGSGTAVRLYLPRAAAVAAAAEVPAPSSEGQPPMGAGELVLVVEDEGDVRRSTRRMLEELGYRVCEAEDGIAALEVLDRTPDVALVFTDIVMPRMNGHELARLAAARHPGVKLLGTTGYDRTRAEQEDPGAQDEMPILPKPFTVDQLARPMHDLLARPDPGAAPKISA